MTDNHPPEPDEVRAALERLNADPTEDRLRAAVKMLTGFTDEQLDDLGGLGPGTTTH